MIIRKEHVLVFLIAFALLAVSAAPALADGNVNAFIGSKSLDENEWYPVEDHGAFGVEADFGSYGSSTRFAINIIGSAATETAYHPFLGYVDVRGETLELQLGVKGVFGEGTVRPFIGGGLAIVSGYYEVSNWMTTVDDTGSGAGIWLSGGLLFALGHFNLGLELGYSQADVEIFDVDVDAGGTRVGILIGGNW